MSANGSIQTLLLLVGSNPLPNYLAAMALRPKNVWLVHSEETEFPMQQLQTALAEDLNSCSDVRSESIEDPFDGKRVQERIRDLIDRLDQPHLHYTGGTKVMSAHSLKVFYEFNGQAVDVSYLDEPHRCLRFDDGSKRSLSECGVTLTLDRILQLHGVTAKPRFETIGEPTADDTEHIAQSVLNRPELALTLYEERKRLEKLKKVTKAINAPVNVSEYQLELSIDQIPVSSEWSKDQFKTWYKFIGGEWLETWVKKQILRIPIDGISDDSVVTGINCTRTNTGREFEVDVAVLRDQRPYFISCTTDQKIGLCKSKAFEITARARHMGGDLARAAVVCLLDGEDSKGKFVDQLRADLADVWGATNTTRVFGLDDLRAWAGHHGAPNLEVLKEWFDS